METLEKMYTRFELGIFKLFDSWHVRKCDKILLSQKAKEIASVFELHGTPDFEDNYKYLKQQATLNELMLYGKMSKTEAIEFCKNLVEKE